MAQKEVMIFPWSMSATGQWSEETGLLKLRDDTIKELVEWLFPWGYIPQNTAIVELMAHGNLRRAAEFARNLVEAYPVCERSVRASFGETTDRLLNDDLESFPSKPEEFSPEFRIVFIQ